MQSTKSTRAQGARVMGKIEKVAAKEAQPTAEEKKMSIPTSQQPESKDTGNELKETETAEQPDADAEEETTKKPHLSLSKKITLVRELVKSGKSQEDICEEMNITTSQFKTLYFYLVQQDKVFYDVPHRAPVRRCKIGENGFAISMEKIFAMGAAETFKLGREVVFSFDGNRMICEAIEPSQAEAEDDEVLDEVEEENNAMDANEKEEKFREIFEHDDDFELTTGGE